MYEISFPEWVGYSFKYPIIVVNPVVVSKYVNELNFIHVLQTFQLSFKIIFTVDGRTSNVCCVKKYAKSRL